MQKSVGQIAFATSHQFGKLRGRLRRGNCGLFLGTLKYAILLGCPIICCAPPPVAAADYADTYTFVVKGIKVPPSNAYTAGYDGTWTVKVSYDSSKGTVSFMLLKTTINNHNFDGFTWTIPGTVKGDIVTFDGVSAPPTPPPKKKSSITSTLTFSGATLDIKKGKLTITSVKSLADTFSTTSIVKLDPPAEAPKDGQKAGSSILPDKSLSFNSLTQTLSITGNTIDSLPGSGDPLLGADVTYPNFVLTGYNAESGDYIFVNQNPLDEFTLTNGTTAFQTSTLSYLDYNVAQNIFYSVLTDSTFDSAGSPFIDYVSSALDFDSPSYDPLALYYTEITPDVNFDSLTQGFQITGDAGATYADFLSDSVPEPSTLALFGAGLVGLAWSCRRRRRQESAGPPARRGGCFFPTRDVSSSRCGRPGRRSRVLSFH